MEKTTITHVLTSPGHTLELVAGNREFICYNCTETGTGHRYRCKNCDDLSLHQCCAAPAVTHTLRLAAGKSPGHFVCEECTKICSAQGGEFAVHRGCNAPEEKQKITNSAGGEEARLYIDITKYICSPGNSNALDLRCIGASSTYPPWKGNTFGIENTLRPLEGNIGWWSNGSKHPSLHECLVYRLPSVFCIIDEIKLQPSTGSDNKVHPAKSIRFKMGYSNSANGSATSDEHYTWNYTSPMFSMTKEAVLQPFNLPSPVFCIGGVVKIELFDSVWKHTKVHRYVVSIRRVEILGRQLSPELSVGVSEAMSAPKSKWSLANVYTS